MSEESSTYPDVWDFEAEGNAVLEGTFVTVNAVDSTKYGTDEYEQKFVVNLDVEGTTYAIWLNGAVLKRAFTDEAKNRKAIGKAFEQGEKIRIEYLGKRQGENYTYKDFKVEFEFAAPALNGFDALAGGGPAPAEAGALEEQATEEKATSQGAETPTGDDIPF